MRARRVFLCAGAVLSLGCTARAAEPNAAPSADPAAVQGKPSTGIEEVVVTAERHRSTVQNTAISMTALSGAQLKARGITSVEEVVREVPGLSIRSAGPGQTEYEARGLASTGGAAPTVGFYLNDVPMSPPAAAQTGKVVIDPNLYDVSSIEVLRGPQGTLYGSGSMGGTVRVVTTQPKLGLYEGSVEGIASGTEGANGANGAANLMVNLPINDKLALRLVGSDQTRAGWIDRVVVSPFPNDTNNRGNVLTAPVQSVKHGANTEDMATLRASLLFQPDVDTKVTASVLYQSTRLGGADLFDMPPGSQQLAHFQAFPIAEPFHDIVRIGSLTATHDFGWGSLTSDSAYWERNEKQTQDASENIGNTFGYRPYVPIPYSEFNYTRQFSEEVRLASPEQQSRLRWVAGLFYSDLRSLWVEYSANPAPTITNQTPGQNPSGTIFQADNPYRIKQLAMFADVSVNLTDTIKLSSGFRVNRYESTLEINEWGLAFPTQIARPQHGTNVSAAATAVTPRFNLSWAPTKDLTAYVTASQGYRPGGLNQAVPSFCGAAPSAYNADSVWNYEVGEKARLFDGRLTVNGDFYYDRWTNIQQLLLLNCGYQYYDNAGNGRTFGPELEVTAKITPELTISGSGAYTDAAITSPVALLANSVVSSAQPGTISTCPSASQCTLPILNVPNYTGSISLSYTRQILDKYQLTARITDNYVGPVVDESFYPIINLPPYNLVNLRLTLAGERWAVAAFVDNLTNKHAQISANNTSFQFNTAAYYRVSTNQPLTGGIDLSYKF